MLLQKGQPTARTFSVARRPLGRLVAVSVCWASRKRLSEIRSSPVFFFFPELGSAGSAAEGVFAVARELWGVVREDVEEVARGVVDSVVAAEVAGVVIGDGRFAWRGGEFFVGDEGFEILGVVEDLVVPADLFVFVAEGVHAVWAAGYDEFGADGV